MNKFLSILSLVSDDNKAHLQFVEQEWKRYFNFKQKFDSPQNIKQYLNRHVDILFLDDTSVFRLEYYEKFKKGNSLFSYIVLADRPSQADVENYKLLVDRILYTDLWPAHFRWSTIATLRSYWEKYSNQSIIIYRNIIADFVENNFSVDKINVELTKMEAKLLRIFMTNINKNLNKNEIYKKVWGYEDYDISRNFDQMFFKLKSKIGKEYFIVKRNKGIIFK